MDFQEYLSIQLNLEAFLQLELGTAAGLILAGLLSIQLNLEAFLQLEQNKIIAFFSVPLSIQLNLEAFLQLCDLCGYRGRDVHMSFQSS